VRAWFSSIKAYTFACVGVLGNKKAQKEKETRHAQRIQTWLFYSNLLYKLIYSTYQSNAF
jgi:hypothetical protein